jgi:mono/diheme cytochrome c family protein
MKTIRVFLLTLVVLALAIAALIYSGRYDVSASQSPLPLEEWVLSTIKQRSIARHSRGLTVPPLGAPAQLKQGFELFRSQCTTCHGGPGVSSDNLAMGLTPVPPGLDFPRVQAMSDAELFWVVKNGIKLTGMPGFGMGNSDEDLWAVVAFLRKLPNLSPTEFEAMSTLEPAAPAAAAPEP